MHDCKGCHYSRQGPHYTHSMENPLADIEHVRNIADPAERARELGKIFEQLPAITAELRTMRQAAVRELRDAGWSYTQIGEALGVHRNRAQQIAEGRVGGNRGKPPLEMTE